MEEVHYHKKLVAAFYKKVLLEEYHSYLPIKITRNYLCQIQTNLIEGGISPLKILIKIHRGLSKSLKLKIVDDYLVTYKKK